MHHMTVKIHPSWKEQVGNEFDKPYFKKIKQHLVADHNNGKRIYPAGSKIFNAFDSTPFNEVKVVIIGQDPYHGQNQAHGLSFSVQPGVRVPPSLQNIYKELQADIPDFKIPTHGHLQSWADQGVLLLNAFLTVRAGEPASHRKIGWEEFTDEAIRRISEEKENVVFLLWGKFAQNKEVLIDNEQHLILKAAHPSPYSANNGFFGCSHFSKTNQFLTDSGQAPINWQV